MAKVTSLTGLIAGSTLSSLDLEEASPVSLHDSLKAARDEREVLLRPCSEFKQYHFLPQSTGQSKSQNQAQFKAWKHRWKKLHGMWRYF